MFHPPGSQIYTFSKCFHVLPNPAEARIGWPNGEQEMLEAVHKARGHFRLEMDQVLFGAIARRCHGYHG